MYKRVNNWSIKIFLFDAFYLKIKKKKKKSQKMGEKNKNCTL